MTCDRCHNPIRPGEAHDTHIPDNASGAAPTIYMHRRKCKPVPRQTVPEDRPWYPRYR